MGKIVGIDLGTTNSVVAHYEGRRPKVLTLSAGRQMMRSAVSLRESRSGGEPQTLVGDPAISYWEYAPKDTIVSIKRLMGRVFDDNEVQKVREDYSYEIGAPSDGSRDSVRVLMGGSEYSPVDISAIILRQIKEDAEKRLTDEVTHAVITVPAYFNQAQNADTRLAGQRAGLKVIRLLDEPTAAAVAYGQQIEGLEDSQAGAPKTLLVYDLGGGTFDISILVWSGNTYTTLGIEGDMWLGGDNFDHVVMGWALDQIHRETGIRINPDEERWKTFMVGLLQRVQQAKVMLSGSPSADIVVPNSLRDENGVPIPLFLELTRDQYESMIEPLVDRADGLIDKALENTGLVEGDIDHVLLAGNATLTPLVQRKVSERFGRDKIVHAQNPKYVVAEGAAVVARMLAGRTICPDPDCQHVNEEDAERCAKCGQSLAVTGKKCWSCGTVNEEDAERCISCGVLLREKEEEPVWLVAERDYGIQMMDGGVAAFVKKGDPIPTMDATRREFVTREGNQRMMLLRVWGGEDLQNRRIDENGGNDGQDLELQGEAVVFLPPRLVEGTQVRVSLSLDRDRVFVPEAQLVNGDNLRCVVIKDEGSQAVDALYRLDNELHGLQMGGLEDDQESQAEQLRDQVVGALEGRQEAGQPLNALQSFLEGLSGGSQSDVESQAEMLLAFVGDLTQNYSWGLAAQHVHQLTQLAAQVKESLQLYQTDKSAENRRRLESAVRALDGATDQEQLQSEDVPLSRDMILMLGIRSAIWTRVRPRNSQQAAELIQEHEEIRKGFAAGESSARAQLMLFAIKVTTVIKGLGEEPVQPEPEGVVRTCPICGAEVQPGELQCPNGHIQILPDVDKSHSWSEFGA